MVATHMWASKHTGGHPNMKEGIQTYGWCPNIWGHPNIQEGVQTYGSIQTYRGTSKHMWGSKHTEGVQT